MSRKQRQKLFGKGFVSSNAMGRKIHGREGITRQIRVSETQVVSRLTQERRAPQAAQAPWVSQVDPAAREVVKVVRKSKPFTAEKAGPWSEVLGYTKK